MKGADVCPRFLNRYRMNKLYFRFIRFSLGVKEKLEFDAYEDEINWYD